LLLLEWEYSSSSLAGVQPTPSQPTQSSWKLEAAGGAATLKETVKGRPEDVQEAAVVLASAEESRSCSL